MIGGSVRVPKEVTLTVDPIVQIGGKCDFFAIEVQNHLDPEDVGDRLRRILGRFITVPSYVVKFSAILDVKIILETIYSICENLVHKQFFDVVFLDIFGVFSMHLAVYLGVLFGKDVIEVFGDGLFVFSGWR